MRTRTKKILGGAVAATLTLLAGLYLSYREPAPARPASSTPASLRTSPQAGLSPSAPAAQALEPDEPADAPEGPAAPPTLAGDPEAELEQLATFMRERYGAKLKEPYIQVKMLENLMRYFQKRYPDRWEQELLAFLKKTFPEMYDALAATLRNRIDYEKWVRDNDAYLRGLDPKQRRAAVWDARNRLFGKEDAERIWASELRSQSVADALAALDAKAEATVTEKLSTYKQRLNEIYGEHTEVYLARHRQEMMDRFLDLSSIQQALTEMTPEQRSQHLRTIRKEIGLDDEALKRWDELDQTREVRWEAGARYMAEREALAKQLSGAELEAKLQGLRARYFGAEAEVIAHEEAAGFFRFERPRKWGRN
jgi:hypothetical protein